MTKKTYKSLAELAEAFDSGELSREEWSMVIDNDCSYLMYRGPCPFEPGSDAWDNFYDGKNDEVDYDGNGPADFGEALDLIGISNEPA